MEGKMDARKKEELEAVLTFVEHTKEGKYVEIERSSQEYARMKPGRVSSSCKVYEYRMV